MSLGTNRQQLTYPNKESVSCWFFLIWWSSLYPNFYLIQALIVSCIPPLYPHSRQVFRSVLLLHTDWSCIPGVLTFAKSCSVVRSDVLSVPVRDGVLRGSSRLIPGTDARIRSWIRLEDLHFSYTGRVQSSPDPLLRNYEYHRTFEEPPESYRCVHSSAGCPVWSDIFHWLLWSSKRIPPFWKFECLCTLDIRIL